HLSFVAGISRGQRRELAAHGLTTLQRFGEIVLPLPFKPGRGSRESLERAQRQARVQLEGRTRDEPVRELLLPVEADRGLALLPQPSPGDVFLDLEGDHFAAGGGREYLFGMTVVGPGGATSHRQVWAHTGAEEKAAFETITDDLLRISEANPGMHV